ncbi:MAG: 1-acyl-sn-glycerol-3-phosphate acyltransferase [Clostridia bacterium]|nr:1-acyl-sn-glycerol-3-phosphate acyltransferase [Clostridia bacterium]
MKKDKMAQKKDRPSFFYRFVFFLTAWIAYPLFRIKVISGKNSLPKEGACIVAGNHIHFVDPVFLSYAQRRQIRFMAKAELFDIPVLSALCKWYGAFAVSRGTADTKSVNTAIDILESGRVLGIFPEGTRSKDGTIGRGKAGVAMIAHRTQAPIYPFALYCKGKPFSLFCKYTIAFGDPVTPQELGLIEGTPREYREATRRLMQIITELHEKCIEARA